MANPSVTYTFSNGTTADATQVNQNFTDLINGLTDGTKSLTVDAITAAGSVSFQGNVTLGNGSVDDLTISASLASSIPIKTNNSFNIGAATLGLAGIYLGAPSSRTTRITSNQSIAGSLTFVTPVSAGSSGQKMVTDGSGNLSFANSGFQRDNLGIAASVSANALTVALKDASGSDPSASSPVFITFRNATATTGTPVTRTVTAALSMTVTAGAELGHLAAVDQYVWVYAIDNAGTVELAVSGTRLFDEASIQSTSGVGSGSDDGNTLYSTTTRSNVAIALLGRLTSNQAAAGTWATAMSEVAVNYGAIKKRPSFRISEYLSGGSASRVTGSAPTSLGQYRTYLRNANAQTYTETNGAPGTAPSAANGMLLYGPNAWNANDTNAEPSRYEIFVGKNKFIVWELYSTTGRTGGVAPDLFFGIPPTGGTTVDGSIRSYDPTTGIASIVIPMKSQITNQGNFGVSQEALTEIKDGYFDIVVMEIP